MSCRTRSVVHLYLDFGACCSFSAHLHFFSALSFSCCFCSLSRFFYPFPVSFFPFPVLSLAFFSPSLVSFAPFPAFFILFPFLVLASFAPFLLSASASTLQLLFPSPSPPSSPHTLLLSIPLPWLFYVPAFE